MEGEQNKTIQAPDLGASLLSSVGCFMRRSHNRRLHTIPRLWEVWLQERETPSLDAGVKPTIRFWNEYVAILRPDNHFHDVNNGQVQNLMACYSAFQKTACQLYLTGSTA